jgi:radical SAM protein with 4Fe4S-binding SPASM domain
MDYILERLKKWKEGEEQGPIVLDISPTDTCNLRCKSCWQRNKKFDGKLNSKVYELPDERLLGLIDEAYELGIKQVEITGGGEPLTRRITLKLIEKIKKYGMYGSITTNGTLFTPGLIESMVSLKWDKVVFSIDGGEEKTQNFLRGRDYTFSKNREALLMFKKTKKDKKSDLPLINFNSVLSNANFKELEKIIIFAHEVGSKAVNFETLTVHSEQGLKLKLNKSEQENLASDIKRIKRTALKYGIETNIEKYCDTFIIEKSNEMQKLMPASSGTFSSVACFEPWYHMVVKVDGSVGPCCVFSEKKINVRNKSLKEIWQSKYFTDLRNNIKKGRLPNYCKICNAGQVFRNENLRDMLK